MFIVISFPNAMEKLCKNTETAGRAFHPHIPVTLNLKWGVPKIKGTLVWDPYNKDPTI